MSLADPGQVAAAPLALPESATRARVIEMDGGYAIQTERLGGSSGQVTSLVLTFLCFVFVIAAFLVWLAPSQAFVGDAVPQRAAASAIMGALALLMSWRAEPRPQARIEIDLRRRELRDCLALSRGRLKLRRKVPLARLTGVATSALGEVVLHRAKGAPIVVVNGLGAGRATLMARLDRDIAAARAREQALSSDALLPKG